LTAHKSKAATEFEEELLYVADQAGFEFSFVERLFQGKKIKEIRIFQKLLSEAGMCGRQGFLKNS